MAEHHTQGRQGQGARRRRNNNHQGRHRRQRMPRPEATPARKPSLLQRILSFFGFGKKKKEAGKDNEKQNRNKPKQNVRVAKGRNNTANNNGGAIYVTGESVSNVFEYMVFVNNTAKKTDGGAINFHNTVNNCFYNFKHVLN